MDYGVEKSNEVEIRYGCNSPTWMSGFESSEKYYKRSRVLDFLVWANRRKVEPSLGTEALLVYFDTRHDQEKSVCGDDDRPTVMLEVLRVVDH